MAYKSITVENAKKIIQTDAIVVDIRDPMSFAAGHIDDAIQVDNHNIESFFKETDRTKPLIICCYHGISSQGAAEYFSDQGFQEVYSLSGGYAAWRELVESHKKALHPQR